MEETFVKWLPVICCQQTKYVYYVSMVLKSDHLGRSVFTEKGGGGKVLVSNSGKMNLSLKIYCMLTNKLSYVRKKNKE